VSLFNVKSVYLTNNLQALHVVLNICVTRNLSWGQMNFGCTKSPENACTGRFVFWCCAILRLLVGLLAPTTPLATPMVLNVLSAVSVLGRLTSMK